MAQTKTILPTVEDIKVTTDKDKAIEDLNKEIIRLTNDTKNLTNKLTTYRQLVAILLNDLDTINNTVKRSINIANILLTKEEE